ncbi:hypothetical protein GCM10010326_66950 [Streptomyces xanthochromogenes]|uniref:Uncharacterized protein n=1 Tax=Streptomyces xanthochromogenes TaxID=67384 RepID=A0ABQ3AQM4_9ACTN|nr:hypothetical protein GCM10010326_66950 [Streptomyces xanthochromogenes]
MAGPAAAVLTTIRVGRTGGRDSTTNARRPYVPDDAALAVGEGAGDRARLRAPHTGAAPPRPYVPRKPTAYNPVTGETKGNR